MRKLPGSLGLKKFGPVIFWSKCLNSKSKKREKKRKKRKRERKKREQERKREKEGKE